MFRKTIYSFVVQIECGIVDLTGLTKIKSEEIGSVGTIHHALKLKLLLNPSGGFMQRDGLFENCLYNTRGPTCALGC